MGDVAGQIAGLVASGRGQDPLLFDLGSETYSSISMTNEGAPIAALLSTCNVHVVTVAFLVVGLELILNLQRTVAKLSQSLIDFPKVLRMLAVLHLRIKGSLSSSTMVITMGALQWKSSDV